MVTVADEVPSVGEPVRVAWGLAEVAGRVVESYSGVRPRVVVELEPGEVDTDSTTVTVPVAALQPIESSMSNWARAVRYQREVVKAFERIAGEAVIVELGGAPFEPPDIDLLLRFAEQSSVAVEVKARPLTRDGIDKTIKWVGPRAEAIGSDWLLVLPGVEGADRAQFARVPQVAFWQEARDDDTLRQALTYLREKGRESSTTN